MAGIQYQIRGDTRANLAAATPAVRELAVVTDKQELAIGDAATAGGYHLQKKNYVERLTAAQITADQNNYAPASFDRHAGLLEISSDAVRTITGLTGGTASRRLVIANKGTFNIILADANASSTAANRFSFGEDVTIRAGGAIELYYNGTDSRWERVTGGLKVASILEEFSLPGDITPTQIAANTNDYAPTGLSTASRLRLSTDASRNLTGITGGVDGRLLFLVNVGTNPLVLKDASTSSTAGNRFDFGADVTLAGKQTAVVQYDATDSRWKMLANTAGAAVAAGAVIAQTLANSALGLGPLVNGYLDWSVAGSALTIALKTLAGTDPSAADPVYILFRSATAADGKPVILTVTAALSFALSSGSSAGTSSSVPFRLWAVIFNDAGTPRLSLVNVLSGNYIMPLAAWALSGTTAEGGAGAADSAQTFYTGTAIGAAKAYTVLGCASWETGLAAAGTWSAGPTRIQPYTSDVRLPGQVIQDLRAATGTVATGTTLTPVDNTVPQNTEGDQYMSQAITPLSAANMLEVTFSANLSHSAGSAVAIAALFQDTGANAIADVATTIPSAAFIYAAALEYRALAALSVTTTFKVRAGSNTAGTVTFNGQLGNPLMNGTFLSWIRIKEIVA